MKGVADIWTSNACDAESANSRAAGELPPSRERKPVMKQAYPSAFYLPLDIMPCVNGSRHAYEGVFAYRPEKVQSLHGGIYVNAY